MTRRLFGQFSAPRLYRSHGLVPTERKLRDTILVKMTSSTYYGDQRMKY
jgi:hypothetical protein